MNLYPQEFPRQNPTHPALGKGCHQDGVGEGWALGSLLIS
jgi:hypothetical protein